MPDVDDADMETNSDDKTARLVTNGKQVEIYLLYHLQLFEHKFIVNICSTRYL